MTFRKLSITALVAGALLFAGCGDSSNHNGSTGGTATSSTRDKEEVTPAEVADLSIYTMGDEAFYNFCGAVATLGEDSARYEYIAGWESDGFGADGLDTDPNDVFDELVDRCDLGA